MIVENFLELIDIEDIIYVDTYCNMIDIKVKDDESFILSNGIISHNSAAGSLKQARDNESEAVYALKGKVKNSKKLSDLSNNKELLDLIAILGIDPTTTKLSDFNKIIIATDSDCIDENHIVIVKRGNIKIKDITYDDEVLTHTGQYKKIKEIIQTIKSKYIEMEINGEIFRCSDYHTMPIFRDGEIIESLAIDIKISDFLLLRDVSGHSLVCPTKINIIKKELVMYDITVEDDNTFYVKLNNTTDLLSHNCDGHHITSLIINFFYQWFPHIITNDNLYQLITPLVVCDSEKVRKYFYSLDEYDEFLLNNKVTNVNYLKGLGSLSLEDWQFVMQNKMLFKFNIDRSAKKYLDIAFGPSSQKRKNWLSS